MDKVFFMIFFILFCSGNENKSSRKIESNKEIIPSKFEEGERITFHLPTIKGDTIEAYSDTGGGWAVIYPKTLSNLGLDKEIKTDSASNRKYILAEAIFQNKKYFPYLTESQREISNKSYFLVPPVEFLNELSIDQDEEQAFFGQYFLSTIAGHLTTIIKKFGFTIHVSLILITPILKGWTL